MEITSEMLRDRRIPKAYRLYHRYAARRELERFYKHYGSDATILEATLKYIRKEFLRSDAYKNEYSETGVEWLDAMANSAANEFRKRFPDVHPKVVKWLSVYYAGMHRNG